MGINYFTDEQVKLLKTNPNVKNVSNKDILISYLFAVSDLVDIDDGNVL